MRYFIGLILMLTLIGCAPVQERDPGFQLYVDRFEEESATYGYGKTHVSDDLAIRFAALEGSTVGECHFDEHQEGLFILIDPTHWGKASDADRELLMFHELGHCVLEKKHSAGGVMRATLVHDYEPRRAEYLFGLFSH